jgi:hypothetical protein
MGVNGYTTDKRIACSQSVYPLPHPLTPEFQLIFLSRQRRVPPGDGGRAGAAGAGNGVEACEPLKR